MKTKEPFNKKNCAYVHKVTAGDTLYKIARRYGVDYGRLMALNGITNPYQLKTGTEICIPPTLAPGGKNCAGFYVISEGDTLYSIARRFGVSLDDLMAANSDIDPYNMHIGMKLCIPPKNATGTSGQRPQNGQQSGQQNSGAQRPQNGQQTGQPDSSDRVFPRSGAFNHAADSSGTGNTDSTGTSGSFGGSGNTGNTGNTENTRNTRNTRNTGNTGSSGAEEANLDSSLLAEEANFDSYVVRSSSDDFSVSGSRTDGVAETEGAVYTVLNADVSADSSKSDSGSFTEASAPASAAPAAGFRASENRISTGTDSAVSEPSPDAGLSGSSAFSAPASPSKTTSAPVSNVAAMPYVSDTMPDGILYRVEQGETLTDILRKFGICFSALDYCNSSVDFNRDLTGLTLNIPYGDRFCIAPNNQPYIIRRNDTLDTLSLRFDISTDDLLRLNPTRKPEDFSNTGGRINVSDET